VPCVVTAGLEVEPREPHAHGLRDMEGQRPVDRDEAVRDEGPGAPVPGLDVGLREVGLRQQPGERGQMRVQGHVSAHFGRVRGRRGGGSGGLGSHERSPVPGCPAVK
jgi:hypothetical protein